MITELATAASAREWTTDWRTRYQHARARKSERKRQRKRDIIRYARTIRRVLFYFFLKADLNHDSEEGERVPRFSQLRFRRYGELPIDSFVTSSVASRVHLGREFWIVRSNCSDSVKRKRSSFELFKYISSLLAIRRWKFTVWTVRTVRIPSGPRDSR